MPIVKVDPFREFAAMQDRMNRLFGNVYLRDEDTGLRGTWVPAVDIFETEAHDLVVRAELPGMAREDIDVTVENNTLVLHGEKKFDRSARSVKCACVPLEPAYTAGACFAREERFDTRAHSRA